MTSTQMIDYFIPYTKEDMRCGFKKKKKIVARLELLKRIEDMQDADADNEEIFENLLNERNATIFENSK